MNTNQATLIMNKKNTIKTIYNSEIERIQPILKKFLNTKITTTQETKTKAFEKALKKDDDFKHNLNLFSDFIAIKINRIYYKILYGSLSVNIRVSFTDLKEENNFRRTTKIKIKYIRINNIRMFINNFFNSIFNHLYIISI